MNLYTECIISIADAALDYYLFDSDAPDSDDLYEDWMFMIIDLEGWN